MVKVILTEVLLEVTNEEMATVAQEERRKACKKAARQKGKFDLVTEWVRSLK